MTFLVNTNNITGRHLTNLKRGRKMENCTQLLIHQVLHLYLQRSIHLLRDSTYILDSVECYGY